MKWYFIAKKVSLWGFLSIISVFGVYLLSIFAYDGGKANALNKEQSAFPVEGHGEILEEGVFHQNKEALIAQAEEIAPAEVKEEVVTPVPVIVEKTQVSVVTKTDKRIQCKMKIKEIKKDKKDKNKDLNVAVSWECTNELGWSCDIFRDKGKNANDLEKNVTLPKGSKNMTVKVGKTDTDVRVTQDHVCSYDYASNRYSCTFVPKTKVTTSYNSQLNLYKMECRSVDGKIMRFDAVKWK